jgi:hypothetical protein
LNFSKVSVSTTQFHILHAYSSCGEMMEVVWA